MLSESRVERAERFSAALDVIAFHNEQDSFKSLIETSPDVFKGFQFLYSTNNTESNIGSVSLSQFEEKCSSIKNYYYGSGLLIYEDSIYNETIEKRYSQYPLNFSLYLDSNVAESFRVWENKGKVSPLEKFLEFCEFKKAYNFSFDYSFFMLENMESLMDEGNLRPFSTIRALIRFDHSQAVGTTPEEFGASLIDKDRAGKQAILRIAEFMREPGSWDLHKRRKVLHLVLLKATSLYLNDEENFEKNLHCLVDYCLDKLGLFPKMELYFAWKMLKYKKEFSFFSPVDNEKEKMLQGLKGMSWDLFARRYQETISSTAMFGEYHLPFFVSYDNKYRKLSEACPVRCTLFDSETKRLHTLYSDEIEFNIDLQAAITPSLANRIHSKVESEKRLKQSCISPEFIDAEVVNLSETFG